MSEITCINKNHRGLVVRVGGDGWSLSNHEAIVKLISAQIYLNVKVNGELKEVGVRGEGSDAYLALEYDGTPLNTLSHFQSCGAHSFQ